MTVPVNELDVGRVAIGQNATIQLDALTGVNIPGKVENVGWLSATSSDGIVTYDVLVTLDTTDPHVRLGMTGEVAIDTGSSSS
jgi:HlyD family secretion protein